MVLNANFTGFKVSLEVLSSHGKVMLHSCRKPQYPLAQSLHVSSQAHWAASDKNKSKGEARSGSVDSNDRDQIPDQAMGFLRRGYLNRTLLWLIGDRVTPWTSEVYLSLESDAEGQRDEMLKGWNVIPAASLPPFSPFWLWYKSAGPAHVALFYVHSADHEFRSLQLNWCLFCTAWASLALTAWKSNILITLQPSWFRLGKLPPIAQLASENLLILPQACFSTRTIFFQWLITSLYLLW